MVTIFSCEKVNHSPQNCFSNEATIREITNQKGMIKSFGENFFIVEQNAIVTKL